MTTQMQVDLPLEKARQYLLKYFETRDDIKVKDSELNYVRIRTSGSRYPWINIEIGMFGEENRTRLTINFSFRRVYAITTAVTVMVLTFCWVIAVNLFESIFITVIIGTGASITFAYEISKAKRNFLYDIRKAFDLLDKTRNLFP